MHEAMFAVALIVFLGFCLISQSSCQEQKWGQQIINAGGFCIQAEPGQKFKCYEVKLREDNGT